MALKDLFNNFFVVEEEEEVEGPEERDLLDHVNVFKNAKITIVMRIKRHHKLLTISNKRLSLYLKRTL